MSADNAEPHDGSDIPPAPNPPPVWDRLNWVDLFYTSATSQLDQAGRWVTWGGPALGMLAGIRALILVIATGQASRGEWLVGLLDLAFLVIAWTLAGVTAGALIRILGQGLQRRLEQFAVVPPGVMMPTGPSGHTPLTPAASPSPVTALELLRDETFAEIRRAIRTKQWDEAREKLSTMTEDLVDDSRLNILQRELENAVESARVEHLADLEAARAVNDPERVLELHQYLAPLLEAEARALLEADLSGWFLRLIHNRLRTGRIQAELAQLAGRIAETFSHTVEGASLRASLPTLRRSAGLCPRCAQPYTGVANACPTCLAQPPATPRPTSLGGHSSTNGGA